MRRRKINNNLEKFTLLVIPQNTSKTKQLNISKKTILLVMILAFVFTSASITVGCFYYKSQSDIKTFKQIKAEKLKQEQTINELDQQIDEINRQKEVLEAEQQKIKDMMGIEVDANTTNTTPSDNQSGKGGEDIAYNDISDMSPLEKARYIKKQMKIQENELDAMLAQVSKDKEYFRAIPNIWPVHGDISSPYGWRSSPFGGQRQSFHNGIDIANNVGTSIVAAADGKVELAGWYGAYGRAVMIDHGYGFKTLYGHNYRTLVKAGDEVRKGQEIAYLGNTGLSTGPHLHFSIFKYDVPLDPMLFLPQ